MPTELVSLPWVGMHQEAHALRRVQLLRREKKG